MSDTKMLQAVLNGQASMREEMKDMENRLTTRIDNVEDKIHGVEKNLILV
jgi:hypothetical protein